MLASAASAASGGGTKYGSGGGGTFNRTARRASFAALQALATSVAHHPTNLTALSQSLGSMRRDLRLLAGHLNTSEQELNEVRNEVLARALRHEAPLKAATAMAARAQRPHHHTTTPPPHRHTATQPHSHTATPCTTTTNSDHDQFMFIEPSFRLPRCAR